MDGNDEVCLGLGLGLGLNDQHTSQKGDHPQKKNKRVFFLDLSIPLDDHGGDSTSSLKIKDDNKGRMNNSFFKEDDIDSNCSTDFSRKKLRLSRDQTTLLEDSFKQHTTLNTAQKQALAEKLNLKPRQVEVWFQNRRARTKLKQTEVDCEFLKKNCERLSEENWRLKKELLELRSSLKIEKPKPNCETTSYLNQSLKRGEKIVKGRGGGEEHEAAAAAVMEVDPKKT